MKRTVSKSTDRKAQSQRAATPEKKVKAQSYTQGDQVAEDIDDILMDINIKKPKTSYNFYLVEMMNKEKLTSMIEANQTFSKKWAKMSEGDKKKYVIMQEKDKERYDQHLDLVKKHLLQKPLKQGVTAYRIYMEENVKLAIDNNDDVSDAKKVAAARWKEMPLEERKEYENKRKVHEEFYENLKKSKGTISAFNLFYRDQITKAKEKDETLPLMQAQDMWRKQKQNIKDKYAEYAEEVREEREKQRDMYEIALGVKPRRPLGAYKFFLIEAANQGKLGRNPIIEGPKVWKKLSDEEKERYQRIAHKEKLVYILKKMEYDAQVKKTSSTRPMSAFNHYVADMKDKVTGEDAANFFEYCYKKWTKSDDAIKRKYHQKAAQSKQESETLKEEMRSRVNNAPKRPALPYNIFVQQNYDDARKANPKRDVSEIFSVLGQQWKKLNDNQKDKFNKLYEKSLEVYNAQVEQFKEMGFYTNSDTSKKSRRSRSQSVTKSTKKAKKAQRGMSRE